MRSSLRMPLARSIAIALALAAVGGGSWACARGTSARTGGDAAASPPGSAKPILLLSPRLDLPAPLMKALKDRRSSRDFAETPLDLRLLSDLLWAADGVNRADSGKRTAPTAMNRQDLEVYAATADGLYLYDAKAHALAPVSSEDLRALTGHQGFAGKAPLDLVYVSDLGDVPGTDREAKLLMAGAHAGFVSQNVYLFCAAAGLATVVRAYIDKPKLAAAMKLGADHVIVLAQTVGFPADAADAGE
jgi:nitroreductase